MGLTINPLCGTLPKNTCGTCKWLEDPDMTSVCVCAGSDHCADFVSKSDGGCECWEPTETAEERTP